MDINENAVNSQLKAYNNHDIDDFIKWYANDAIGIDIDTGNILFNGVESMNKLYGELFKNKFLHCKIMQRIILNKRVVDYERISKDSSDAFVESIVIYDINNEGLIQKVRFLKENAI